MWAYRLVTVHWQSLAALLFAYQSICHIASSECFKQQRCGNPSLQCASHNKLTAHSDAAHKTHRGTLRHAVLQWLDCTAASSTVQSQHKQHTALVPLAVPIVCLHHCSTLHPDHVPCTHSPAEQPCWLHSVLSAGNTLFCPAGPDWKRRPVSLPQLASSTAEQGPSLWQRCLIR